MPVLFAAFGESLRISAVGTGIEHSRIGAIAGDAIALKVGQMLREWRRTKAAATVAYDPGHDDDPPAGRAGDQGQRPPSAAEGRAPPRSPAASPECLATVAGLLAARITSPTKLFGRLAPWLP